MDFILRLQHTAPMDWFRESGSLYAYRAVLFLHTNGLAAVAGPACGACAVATGRTRNPPAMKSVMMTSLRILRCMRHAS